MLLLSGCSTNDMSEIDQFIREIKLRPAGGIEPIKEFQNYESYQYQVAKLRSPFIPDYDEAESIQPDPQKGTGSIKAASGPSPDTNRIKESLEGFPLDTLHYVGSLEQAGQLWAIVVSPDQMVHRIQVGNYLGQNYGKVTAVSETEIKVSELLPDGNGGWMARQAGLSLADK